MKIFLASLLATFFLHASILSTPPATIYPNNAYVANNTLYLSCVGDSKSEDAKPFAYPGYINTYTTKGKLIKQGFIKGLDSPKGMAYKKGILYVSTNNHILGFNQEGKKIYSYEVPKSSKLGSMVFEANGFMLVADEGDGSIYELDIKNKKYRIFATLEISYGIPRAMLIYDGKLFLANAADDGAGSFGFYNLQGDRSFVCLRQDGSDYFGLALNNNYQFLLTAQSASKPQSGRIIKLNQSGKLLFTYPLINLASPKNLSFYKGKIFIPLKASSKLMDYNLPEE